MAGSRHGGTSERHGWSSRSTGRGNERLVPSAGRSRVRAQRHCKERCNETAADTVVRRPHQQVGSARQRPERLECTAYRAGERAAEGRLCTNYWRREARGDQGSQDSSFEPRRERADAKADHRGASNAIECGAYNALAHTAWAAAASHWSRQGASGCSCDGADALGLEATRSEVASGTSAAVSAADITTPQSTVPGASGAEARCRATSGCVRCSHGFCSDVCHGKHDAVNCTSADIFWSGH
mmetsp:Transcript_13001/g.30901  ORF Transcript_13001/g.30901 Transcript_13001/m.30901 type:complete len:241 (-) Transcript_13001:74-796(-)